MSEEVKFVCAVSNEEIKVGDKYVMRAMKDNADGEGGEVEKMVKLEHAGMTDEEVATAEESGVVKTRTE